MGLLKSWKESLMPDHFVSSTAVFPDINTEAIANDLRLAECGAKRGAQNLPAETEETLDTIEQKIVAKVSELRRNALNRYEDHLHAYEARLLAPIDSKTELKQIEGVSRTNFDMARVDWETMLTNERARVSNYYSALQKFQEKNDIWRPVYEPWSRIASVGFVAIMVVLEVGLNAYFFTKAHESGWVGGVGVAFFISILNVFVSGIAGYFSRNVIHVSAFRKTFGFILILLILALAVIFNFAVAHFRDAVEVLLDWYQAAAKAPITLKTTPFALVSIESWLLIGIGLLICGVSFWKGWALDDPYPGYSRVYRGLENARSEYANHISLALKELKKIRDDAVEDLQIAQTDISSAVRDAIQVLYSKHGLREQRGVFLEHANQSVNLLLTIYREHNTSARQSNPPKHFSKTFAFERITTPPLPRRESRLSAEKNLRDINTIIDDSINSVFAHCHEAIESLQKISDLQRNS